MILTPLQLIALIGIILVVCGTITWLTTMHQRDKFNQRTKKLQTQTDSKDLTNDDIMAIWNAIVTAEQLEHRDREDGRNRP